MAGDLRGSHSQARHITDNHGYAGLRGRLCRAIGFLLCCALSELLRSGSRWKGVVPQGPRITAKRASVT